MNGVVVTGIGLVSPLGLDPKEAFARLCAGDCAARAITSFDASPFPTRMGHPIQGFNGRDWVENRKNLKLMTPAVQFGMAAAKLAVQSAGLTLGATTPERFGMFVGAGTAFGDLGDLVPALGKATDADGFDMVRFARDGMPVVNPLWLLKGLSNNVLGYASAVLDAQGINQNYCNSGVGALQAVGEAAWALAEDRADIIIAGASDSAVNPEHFAGFGRLGVLETGPRMRPFDVRHNGFLPGEGAAFFVLERAAHAAARGVRPMARVAGLGNATALRGLSAADPHAVAAALRQALQVAGWAPKDVDLIHAHGNGNPQYDACEAEAIGEVFGERSPAITADKGAFGHAISAGGALSLAMALQAQRAGVMPPVTGLEEPFAGARGLDLVIGQARPIRPHRSLVHTAGLGGQTCVLAIEALGADGE